jgi:hypothetical protein
VSAWEILAALGRSYLFVLAALLPILNPPATAPIFLSMTEGASASTRRLLARRIARNTILLLMGSMLVGSYVLDFFGISLPIVRVGGGLIVATAAWRLLSPGQQPLDEGSGIAKAFTAEQASRQARLDRGQRVTGGGDDPSRADQGVSTARSTAHRTSKRSWAFPSATWGGRYRGTIASMPSGANRALAAGRFSRAWLERLPARF